MLSSGGVSYLLEASRKTVFATFVDSLRTACRSVSCATNGSASACSYLARRSEAPHDAGGTHIECEDREEKRNESAGRKKIEDGGTARDERREFMTTELDVVMTAQSQRGETKVHFPCRAIFFSPLHFLSHLMTLSNIDDGV